LVVKGRRATPQSAGRRNKAHIAAFCMQRVIFELGSPGKSSKMKTPSCHQSLASKQTNSRKQAAAFQELISQWWQGKH